MVSIARLSCLLQAAAVFGEVCPIRRCLPEDDTTYPPLCYTETFTVFHVFVQSFATCPAEAPNCPGCIYSPPCEGHCTAEPTHQKLAGAGCKSDNECFGPFAKCIGQLCRNALHTNQKCDMDNPNDVCIYGQKSCFRGQCQGLKTGDYCTPSAADGRDIDCKAGWYCNLGVCTPQLPAKHGCSGLVEKECIRQYQCNVALPRPLCVKEYTLDLGELSSTSSLCKSNHVDPRVQQCAVVPPTIAVFGKPVVSGVDCTDDTQCVRGDESLGTCTCKRWWAGAGGSRYCELAVQDVSRPVFKLFWESRTRLCHHDWTLERCAYEIGLEDALRTINMEFEAITNDPTAVQSCGADMLSTPFLELGSGVLPAIAARSVPLLLAAVMCRT